MSGKQVVEKPAAPATPPATPPADTSKEAPAAPAATPPLADPPAKLADEAPAKLLPTQYRLSRTSLRRHHLQNLKPGKT